MSNKSGTSEQIISLPKGGGAVQGLGEKFSPDLHTGTGNFSVPIALPPGRNGFQPQLSLTYSTGNGNGPLGLGWSLSVPGISRKTSKGVPVYDDASDIFILSGAEDLTPVYQGAGFTRYRPRTEGLFAQIDHFHDTAGVDYWRVRTKDGLTSYYGTRPEDRIAGQPDSAVIADPDRPGHIYAWKLTLTADLFGNRIEYCYVKAPPPASPRHWDQTYLNEIRYVDYEVSGQTRYLVHVQFVHEERPDPFSDYRPGFEIRTTRRYTAITVWTQADADRQARSYNLVYLDARPEAGATLPLNGASLLSQVRLAGYDDAGQAVEEMPPLEFGYTTFEPARRRFCPVTGAELPPASLAHPNYELADMFGRGLPDIIEMNGTARYWRNRGDGHFDRPRQMADAPAGVSLGDLGVQMLDADGDGRIDLLLSGPGIGGYYSLAADGGWDRRSFQRYAVAPSFDLRDPEVKLVDLDGDGITDAVRSGTGFEYFYNRPASGGWTATGRAARLSLEEFPNVTFSDPRVKWGAMTGSLQDIVLVHDGRVQYWPNLGHGRWGRRIGMSNCPSLPYGYDPRRILLGDVDGDGLADMAYVDDHRVTLWLNRGGNGWSDPIVIPGTPAVSDVDAVRLVDLMGNGVSGILWSADAAAFRGPNMFFLDLTGGTKPYLLAEMDNHLGAVTKVAYAPSTRFYLDDAQRPETRWRRPLPFPVQTVARVEVLDGVSHGKLTTEYRYHQGYWDGAEREFRGFAFVEHLDTECFVDYNGSGLHDPAAPHNAVTGEHYSPPVLTRTWFHQGPVGPEYGAWHDEDLSDQYWPGDPPLLTAPVDPDDPVAHLPRRGQRDASRALRGSVLRTELYAYDGDLPESDPLQAGPYTVTEASFAVSLVADQNGSPHLVTSADPLPGGDPASFVFFPHQVAERTTAWERGFDPMVQIAFTDGYDDYGRPMRQTSVALPRRLLCRHPVTAAVNRTVQVDETCILATHVWTTYAVPDAGLYLHDRIAQARSFELAAPPTVAESQPGDLAQVLADWAAAAAAVRAQFLAALAGWQPGQPLPAALRLNGHTINHYDGPAFEGRAAAETVGGVLAPRVGPFGSVTRTETLAFTAGDLAAAYGDRRPVYLGGTASLPAGAPNLTADGLGYHLHAADSLGYHAGYYVDTTRQQADFQAGAARSRGLVTGLQDALRNPSAAITFDAYGLLPIRVADAVQLVTTAAYNYRTLQPLSVTDPNGNRMRLVYSPNGLLLKQYLQGHDDEGGSEAQPEIAYTYDFGAYDRTRHLAQPQPIYVHTRSRVYHLSQGVSDEVIEQRQYSDGFGRLVQARAQAEDLAFGSSGSEVGLPPGSAAPGATTGTRQADRVAVSGWQIYDNKGRVVEKYEGFFGCGWSFQAEAEARQGVRFRMYFDALGRQVHALKADGSQQRTVFGVPADLGQPGVFAASPWDSYAYDANDLAPLCADPDDATHTLAGQAPSSHHYTPSNSLRDALGRTIAQVVRNGSDPAQAAQSWYLTRSSYDLRGNLLSTADALGRPALQNVYDLLNRPLASISIDAGWRTTVSDALGRPVEYRDDKGSLVIYEYDLLGRPARFWGRDNAGAGSLLTLRERLDYGDGGDPNQPGSARAAEAALNRLGRLRQHHDEAGVLDYDLYDFKGNLLSGRRRAIVDSALAAGWVADWSRPDAETKLDPAAYATMTSYDALNRPRTVTHSVASAGYQTQLTPHYNRAGALDAVTLDGQPFVRLIAYNARGQRMLIAYGNGVMTRYAYEPRTFRLLRLRSERYVDPPPAADTWAGTGAALQDLGYSYDLTGNITAIADRSPASGIKDGAEGRDALTRQFTYDPLYRLTAATGRACEAIDPVRLACDGAICGFYAGGGAGPTQGNGPDLTEAYTQHYAYDPAGNLLSMGYLGARSHAGWTRAFGFAGLPAGQWQAAASNRLTSVAVGSASAVPYQYDANGNLVQQSSERHYAWDRADRLVGFTVQPDACTTASQQAVYLYDSAGNRVKKWTRTNGTGQGRSTVYIGGFEHYRDGDSGLVNHRVHVMDDAQRIAVVRHGPSAAGDAGPAVQYHLGDHLGSSALVLDGQAGWLSREEYFPYGETSFGSFARKRYRFTGKERDEESGLYYHGARYYAPWLGRWTACDPKASTLNLYMYAQCNPLRLVDPTGLQDQEANQSALSGVDSAAAANQASACLATTVRSTFAPVTPSGQALPGAMLWTGQAAQGVAEKAGSAMSQARQGADALAAIQAGESELVVWQRASSSWARSAALSGTKISSPNVEAPATFGPPGKFHQTELKTIGQAGPWGAALPVAAGGITLLSSSFVENRLVRRAGYLSGLTQIGGGVVSAYGAITQKLGLMNAASRVSGGAGGAGVFILSAYAMAKDSDSGRFYSALLNGLSSFSGAASASGTITGVTISGSMSAAAGVSTLPGLGLVTGSGLFGVTLGRTFDNITGLTVFSSERGIDVYEGMKAAGWNDTVSYLWGLDASYRWLSSSGRVGLAVALNFVSWYQRNVKR